MLTTVKWTDEMSVHIPAIDDDHKKIVALLNKVIAAGCAGVGRAAIAEALGELEDYTATHFGREEAMLRAKGYPGLDNHTLVHFKLIQELQRLRSAPEFRTREALDLLSRWLIEHILKTDMAYATYFNEQA
ncbi:MAG: bacteriohemerythrin, partial [Pseudomonadota bacterium]